MDYKDYNDYELLDFISEGNEDANDIMIKKYTPLINSFSNRMLKYCGNNGIDFNDLKQEGFIGLNDALKTFSEQKNCTFYTYAKKCIERKIISALISSNRLKHRVLNESLSFDAEENYVDKLLKDENNNPLVIVENIEIQESLLNNVKNILTDYETQVFELLITDFNYKEIADILGKSPKAIDNTIQRIRFKVKDIINNNY